MKKARLFFIASTSIMVMLTLCVFLYAWLIHTPLDPTNAPTASATQSEKININTASAEHLQELPGIGPKLAQAIVKYRTENGSFSHVGDLVHVPGIGSKKMEAVADLITVGG